MKFEQALKAMKNGEKVKLPSWGGLLVLGFGQGNGNDSM